jgi:hypothetical protein
MTIPQEVESLGIGSTEGCRLRGSHREVLTPTTVNLIPYVLSADQSGALCIFGNSEGGEYELPAAEAGLWFEFQATISVTSTELYTVKCATGDFIVGVVVGGNLTIGASGDVFTADGATHLGLTHSGSTTGGLIGDSYVLTAINSSQWALTQAVNIGSGTNAHPFITS